MSTLVVVEHDRGTLGPASLEALAAARTLGDEVHALTLGAAADALAATLAAAAGDYRGGAAATPPLVAEAAAALASLRSAEAPWKMAEAAFFVTGELAGVLQRAARRAAGGRRHHR